MLETVANMRAKALGQEGRTVIGTVPEPLGKSTARFGG